MHDYLTMKTLFLSTIKRLNFAIFLLCCAGCATPGFIVPRGVDVFKQEPLMEYYQKADLSIAPFLTTKTSAVPGLEAANIFEEEISRKGFFKSIIVIEEEMLLEQIELEQDRIDKARYYAQKNRSHLLLYGTVEEYIPATVQETRLKLNAKLVQVADGDVLWWGSCTVVAKQGGTFLFWGKHLSPGPPPVEKLISKAAKKITSSFLY